MKLYRILLLFLLIFVFIFNLLSNNYIYDLKFLFLLVFITVLCAFFALMEIQIEGKNGWAKKLPTWRYGPRWLLNLTSGKPLTGYHFFVFYLFLPTLFHFPVFFTEWNLFKEYLVLGAYVYFLVAEDFLWFVFNPNFGIKNFNSKNKNIYWHKNWFGPVPDFYVEGLLIALICLSFGSSAI